MLKIETSHQRSVPSFLFVSVLTCLFLISLVSKAEEMPQKPLAKKHESGFFYGAMLGLNTPIYRGVENDLLVVPVVGYKSDNFNFLGPMISYQFLGMGHYSFNAILRYNFSGYEESDSDIFSGMQDRDASLDFGFAVRYKKQNWAANVDIAHDVMNKSNGIVFKAGMGKTYYFGPIFVEPNVGLSYWDKQYVDYYYGVQANEARSDRAVYAGEYAVNQKLGINISTPILFGGFTRLSLEQIWYDASISNSPLTDTSKNVTIRMTFSKFF